MSFWGSFGRTNSLFGSNFNSSFYSSLGDYASIRSGTYKKLMKSYYANNKAGSATTKGSNAIADLKQKAWDQKVTEANKGLKTVRENADALATSAAKLTQTGSTSLFNKTDITTTDAATGEKVTTKDYDRDAIAKAVNSFVSDYNAAVESGASSTDANIVRNTQYMTKMTDIFKNSLADVGITIGKDNKLSVDESKLKSADINTVKQVFNGKSSYASLAAGRASDISSAATKAMTTSASATYGSTGRYNNLLSSYYSTYNWYM